jgi:hypothetical protein
MDPTTKPKKGPLQIRVWTRSRLVDAYDLESEREFVHWAILNGNDFTEHFFPTELGLLYKPPKKIELLDAYALKEVHWTPDSIVKEECRPAVAFSIAFYELEDLTPYLLPEHKTVNQLDECLDIDSGLRLPVEVKTVFRSWFPTVAKPAATKCTGHDLAVLCCTFLDKLVQDHHALTSLVTSEHVNALKDMLKAIVAKKADKKIDPNLKLKYEDMKVANLFQLLIRETEKLMRGPNKETKMKYIKVRRSL